MTSIRTIPPALLTRYVPVLHWWSLSHNQHESCYVPRVLQQWTELDYFQCFQQVCFYQLIDVYYVDYEATLRLIGSIRGQHQVQWMTWMDFLPLVPKAWFPTTGNVTQRTATQLTIPQCNAMLYTNKTVTQRNVQQCNTMQNGTFYVVHSGETGMVIVSHAHAAHLS